MRVAITALMLILGSQAAAECGNLCDHTWWQTATKATLRAELDSGADLKARNDAGATPLHVAAFFGTGEEIQTLLNWGADVMAQSNDGTTPLLLAALNGTTENIQVLLDAGADVTA
jgi:uncharacterized protein